MKCLFIGIVSFTYYYMIWGQDILFPNNEELSHVSGGNTTVLAVITERIPVFISGSCPENMLLYPGDGVKDVWVCDCRPRFLYFPLNDSCYEAYRQGPCPPNQYVVLPDNEAVPRCMANPCLKDGNVQYNGECYPLRTRGGPCAPEGIIGVNETTFELECVPIDIAPFVIIDTPPRHSSKCPAGSRRSTMGICNKL